MASNITKFVANSRDAIDGTQVLAPAEHLKLSDPRSLQKNKNMRHVYIDSLSGTTPVLQIGSPVSPASTAIFMGRDFDTEQPDPSRRSLSLSIGSEECAVLDAVRTHLVDALLNDAAKYFPEQPDITREQVENITQTLYQSSDYGAQMRIGVGLNDGTELFVPHATEAGKFQPATDIPVNDDEKKPVRAGCVILFRWHVYIADARRRKKSGPVYEKIAFKLTPVRLCMYEPSDSVGVAGGTPAPCVTPAAMPDAVQFGSAKPWRDLLFVDIMDGSTKLKVDIGTLDAKAEMVLMPKYSEDEGEVSVADIMLNDDDVACIHSFESNVLLPAIRSAKQAIFGAEVSDEDISDAFQGLMRTVGTKNNVVRAGKLARCQKLVHSGTEDARPASKEDFHITNKVKRTMGAALACEVGLQIKMNGTQLEELVVKLTPSALCITSEDTGSDDLFAGMPPTVTGN